MPRTKRVTGQQSARGSSKKRMTFEPDKPSYLENPDILLHICARSDTETLRSLSRTPLWSLIRVLINTRLFWFLRVQMLRGDLSWDATVAWNDVWKLVEFLRGLKRDSVRSSYYTTEEQSLRTLLSSIEPDPRLLYTCCYASVPSLVREILRSSAFNQEDCCRELYNACGRGDAVIVSILLADGRADPTCYDGGALRSACISGNVEIVRLLLEGARHRTWRYSESLLPTIREFGYQEIVQLLLEDKQRRAMPMMIHYLIVVVLLCLVWM